MGRCGSLNTLTELPDRIIADGRTRCSTAPPLAIGTAIDGPRRARRQMAALGQVSRRAYGLSSALYLVCVCLLLFCTLLSMFEVAICVFYTLLTAKSSAQSSACLKD